jgi:hypothetical protein
MNDRTTGLNKNEEDALIHKISDESLENAVCTGNGKAGNFTLSACTALTVCPGP